MLIPAHPKIYHIVHVDRLPSIVGDGVLWSDSEARDRGVGGTVIGMSNVKERRLCNELHSHLGLHVGECVPFYFCPRSVMLYVIHRGNNDQLEYRDGQEPIIHIEADLRETVTYADDNGQRWAFTSSNAGAYYFDDYSRLDQLGMLDWSAIAARVWRECREAKQSEFLLEGHFPWELVSRIGVRSLRVRDKVLSTIRQFSHRPSVEIKPGWYY